MKTNTLNIVSVVIYVIRVLYMCTHLFSVLRAFFLEPLSLGGSQQVFAFPLDSGGAVFNFHDA